jgi:hypothetical protein
MAAGNSQSIGALKRNCEKKSATAPVPTRIVSIYVAMVIDTNTSRTDTTKQHPSSVIHIIRSVSFFAFR